MQPTDVAVEILKSIRDEVQGLRAEVHSTNERLEGTNERLEGLADEVQGLRADTVQRFDETNDRLGRLERRQTESDVRQSTELMAVVGAVREVRDLLGEDLGLRARVDDHERRIAAVEARAG